MRQLRFRAGVFFGCWICVCVCHDLCQGRTMSPGTQSSFCFSGNWCRCHPCMVWTQFSKKKVPRTWNSVVIAALYLRTRTRNQPAQSVSERKALLAEYGGVYCHACRVRVGYLFLDCMLRKITPSTFSACTWPLNSRNVETKVRGWPRLAVEGADTVKCAASLSFLTSSLF